MKVASEIDCVASTIACGQGVALNFGFVVIACVIACLSSLMPLFCEAVMGMTGMFRFLASFWTLISRPFCSASSIMFSAMTMGNPTSAICDTRYRLRCMFVASTTQTTRSSGAWSCIEPVSMSMTTCSSSDSAAREYVPGRSMSACVLFSRFSFPIFFSTVTPG